MISLKFYCKQIISKLSRFGIVSQGGRNFLGRICIKGRGNGNKKIYRHIDFFRRINQYGYVLKILYDCNRTSYIALIFYENGLNSFIIATANLKLNDKIYSGILNNSNIELTQKYLGWSIPLKNIGLFTIVNNIEKAPFCGAQITRSAGTGSLLIGKNKNKAILKLNSKWEFNLNIACMATIGYNSNKKHQFKSLGSAGKHRNLGFRPKVRGVAKNPCDHPHGGGNGKHSSPVVPVTAYGKPAKWTPTTNKQKDRIKRRLFKKF